MHPILFELGRFQLRSYGLAMAVSFALGIYLSLRLARKAGYSDDLILDLSTWIMLGAVAGARLLYVLVQPQEYLANPLRIFAVWEGGLVYYGGLIGAGFTAYWKMRRGKLPTWALGDVFAPGLALGQVTGRLGCYFNGCCYGREDQYHGLVFPALGDGIPRLPVMLYESAFCLLLSAYLYFAWPRKSFDGQVFWTYVALYALWRFGIEYLRGDAERGVLISAALSPSQWISLAGLGLAVVMLFRLRGAPPAPAGKA